MIRVALAAQPAAFAETVGRPGAEWLAKQGYDLAEPLPRGAKPPPLWRACLPELHMSYRGICAYLAVHVPLATGGMSVDHFIAKSTLAGRTYEWSNYRLACLKMNALKHAFDDVLDPFELPSDVPVFHLELVQGRLYVNPDIHGPLATQAEATLKRLQLDSGVNRALRASHFADYIEQRVSLRWLERDSPFVHAEIVRQELQSPWSIT